MSSGKREKDHDLSVDDQLNQEDDTGAKKRRLSASKDGRTVADEEVPMDLTITIAEIESPTGSSLAMKVNRYIKHILKLWETAPETALLVDTKKALFPLLVKLRKNTLPEEHLTSLMTILYHLQRKEYLRANESYMKLSIGNVAWPIGVIGVSIHARSTQSRLEGGKSNIMIDEQTRKWITGVKRLVTFMENS